MDKKISREQRQEMKGEEGFSKASLHAKTFILDRKWIFIGSLNLDSRSVFENTEIGVVLESPEVASLMAARFDANIAGYTFRLELHTDENGHEQLLWHGFKDGAPKTYTTDPYTGFWRRLGIWFLGLLPIESQL